MTDETTIEQAWEGFRSRVLAVRNLPAEEIESARDLFYNGALVGVRLAMDIVDLDDDDEAMDRLDKIECEFAAHGEELKARIITKVQCLGLAN